MPHTLQHSYLPSRIFDFFLHLKEQFQAPSHLIDTPIYEMEQELLSQKEVLDKISIMSVTDLEGNILYANEKFCEISKYTKEELIGSSHNIIRHPDTPSHIFKEMWTVLKNGGVWQGELMNRAKDGSTYWVYATISPVLDAKSRPIKYISIRQDITKQKKESEELKRVQGLIHKDLYDNVNYARQIHSTFLTPDAVLREAFEESFLIYKAQKIVSGDFYLVQKVNNKSVIILGDSTGHGVSASYMSIIILNILNRLLKWSNYCPGKILERIHHEILSLTSINKSTPIIESADMAFCSIDNNTLVMEYSIAKLRGIIVRNGEVIELDREKISVGEQLNKKFETQTHSIQLRKGDALYLYTDGIIDQFGGALLKKFGNRQLLHTLVENSNSPMEQQKKRIMSKLSIWQGEHEQTDDMSLLGIRIV